MMLHGLGCREPWDMDAGSAAVYADYARLHLALRPVFEQYGREAASGGLPLLRMMPLAFPDIDWSGINDWDQQFMLGPDVLVAPVAFYGNTRAVYLPAGDWYDVLVGEWVSGPAWRVHDVPLDRMPLFLRDGARLTLAADAARGTALGLIAVNPDRHSSVDATCDFAPEWRVDHIAIVGARGRVAPQSSTADQSAMATDIAKWFGQDIIWLSPDARIKVNPG